MPYPWLATTANLQTPASLVPGFCVPFVPTPNETITEMLKLAEIGPGDVLFDLGSGDGRILIAAAKYYGIRAIGIEIDPGRVLLAQTNARQAGVDHLVSILQGDFFQVNFSEASVITMYLLTRVNEKLRPKLWRELKPGCRIVSHRFDMSGWKPNKMVGDKPVYCWVIPSDSKSAPDCASPSCPKTPGRESAELRE
jgi:SAM-dependent methyltransferase